MRPYAWRDRRRVERLVGASTHIHTHLDWDSPETWLRAGPAMLAFQGQALVGLLAAPPEPPGVAWIRLAIVADGLRAESILDEMWLSVRRELVGQGVSRAAALTLEPWLEPILAAWGFAHSHQVAVLSRPAGALPASGMSPAFIRPVRRGDVDAIRVADNAAFDPPWNHSERALRTALSKASYATVAELDGRVVGYQVSSGGRYGAHLARLAVHPSVQGLGIGRQLVVDMLRFFESFGAPAVGVNTQDDNPASLALYQSLGFQHTGESFPVWQLHLP